METRAAEIAVPAIAGLAALAGLIVLMMGRRRSSLHPSTSRFALRSGRTEVPPLVDAVLHGTATALGDAALVLDPAGRLLAANDPGLALLGGTPASLAELSRGALGDDFAVLLRGLARGPASGRVVVPTATGKIVAYAAAVRVGGSTPLDLVVLRTEPSVTPLAPAAVEPEPPIEVTDSDIVEDLPATLAPPRSRLAAMEDAATDVAAIGAGLGQPLARASAAAAMLRMILPPGEGAAAQHLDQLERELRAAEASLAALTSPVGPGMRRPSDVDVLLSEALTTVTLPGAVTVERSRGRAAALVDPAHVRQALRHLLQLAGSGMPSGGMLTLRTGTADGQVLIEIADTGAGGVAPSGLDLPIAQRLIAAQGGTLERTRTAGRGSVCRVWLTAAPGRARASAS